jgi:Leucine-rich repeat (LRR) protein
VSKNTELRQLYINENQLTSLDVSKNTELQFLRCSKNYFTGEDKIIGLNKALLNEFVFDPQNEGTPQVSIANKTNKTASAISFVGIKNGQINLNLKVGNYTVELYNLQGRLIEKTDITAINGVNSTGLKIDGLSRGIFVLNVKQAGVLVLKQKVRIN